MTKRGARWLYLKARSTFRSAKRCKLPSKMGDSEKIGVSLFMKLMLDPESKLHYDVKTAECYIKSQDGSIYLFLENRNLKAINTVVGYDIPLQQETEIYLSEKFIKEMNNRKNTFKREALAKVDHSLQKTFGKIINKNVKVEQVL